MEFRPLEITVNLTSPLCLTYPWIHFDALLFHLFLRKYYPEYRSLPSTKPLDPDALPVQEPFPLKRTMDVYHASVSLVPTKDAYVTTIYKRFCERYLDLRKIRKRSKIHRSRGFLKDFAIRLVVIPAKQVKFYACGDPDRIEELLEGLSHLGKKGAIGYGFVSDFQVREIRKDMSLVRGGKAMRPLPLHLLEKWGDVVVMAYKPPYWSKQNIAQCAPPFSKVKLKNS